MTDKKYKFNDIIPILTLILALLTFMFGPNIISNLNSNVEIVMETELINKFLPEKLSINDTNKGKINSVDSLRIISIKNEGKSTKNLRLLLKLDGPIYFEEIDSTEVITEKKIESESTIILFLDRLSHNSTIELKVWLENEKKQFEVSYTDDVSNNLIKPKSQNEIIYKTILYTLVIVVFFISLFMIYVNYRRGKINKRKIEEDSIVERILNRVSESTLEESIQEENEESQTSTADTNTSLERLRELISQNKKM